MKKVLNNIPDDVLAWFGAGFPEGEQKIALMIWDAEGDPNEKWQEQVDKYPQLQEVDEYIQTLGKAQKYILENDDNDTTGWEEMISPSDFKD